jgi:hypothetical protein
MRPAGDTNIRTNDIPKAINGERQSSELSELYVSVREIEETKK